MGNTAQHAEASAEVQISALIEKIGLIDEEIAGHKDVMKSYKPTSAHLINLKKKVKTLKESMYEEKERIIQEFEKDPTYTETTHELQKKKNERNETISNLKALLKRKYNAPKMQSESHITKSGQMKLHLDFEAQVFINGKALR